MEKMNTFYNMSNYTQKDTESVVVDDYDDQEEAALPGFRFHPTDEELVGFYLRRKVDKKPISIELIKQIDIYKFDPWDLPKPNTVGEKEGYFFCKRGRKYRNSIRPNRVTGSGFWKATGIDKPVYSNGDGGDCIGLKKTLVYYRGSAGKGTKTDWMMHEFRLPANLHANPKCDLQEAEVWTLCRIFKRNVTHRKYTSDWRELSSKRNPINKSSKTTTTAGNSTSIGESTFSTTRECYLSFGAPLLLQQEHDQKSGVILDHDITSPRERSSTTNQLSYSSINAAHQAPPYMASSSPNNIWNNPYEDNHIDLFSYEEVDIDELRSVMDFACSHP